MYDALKQDFIALTCKDPQLKIFGAQHHQYKLRPVLAEEHLLVFEEKHRVYLPSDYRMFLKEFSNGGAGPYYGMYALENYYQPRFYDGSDANYIDQGFLHTPFPYTKNNPCIARETNENLTDEEYAKEFVKNFSGAITLAHQGCGYYDMLIVSGIEKGTVWTDATVSDQGMGRAFDSFTEWYSHWLGTSLEACRGNRG